MKTKMITIISHLPGEYIKYLTVIAVCGLILLTACGEGIDVPPSDSTPPTVKMTAIVSSTIADEVIELTSDTAPVTRELLADKPIKFLAIGTDEDGGIKNIKISGAVIVFCEGQETGLSIHYFANNPDDVEVGEKALTRRTTALHIQPSELCKAKSIKQFQGSFVARAENFHGGTNTTSSFTIVLEAP